MKRGKGGGKGEDPCGGEEEGEGSAGAGAAGGGETSGGLSVTTIGSLTDGAASPPLALLLRQLL